MSTHDTRWDEVPENPLPFFGGELALSERLIDRILGGQSVEPGAAPEAVALADLVTALRKPARRADMHGEATAAAAYRSALKSHAPKEKGAGRSRMSVSARIAVTAFVGTLGMGGVAAAAADGSLPAPLQQLAHVLFSAVPAQADGEKSDDATGGTGPLPVFTDPAMPTPSPEESSATPSPDASSAPVSDLCGLHTDENEFCGDNVEPGSEAGSSAEPGSRPTTGVSKPDATDLNGPENAATTPPATAGAPAGTPAAPPAVPAHALPGGPPGLAGGPAQGSYRASTPPASPGGPPGTDDLTGLPYSPQSPQDSAQDVSLADATSP